MEILDGIYSRVLVIGDLHFPYHHPDVFGFLELIKSRYELNTDNPEHLIISIGDEADGHGWSYHDKDPELASPGSEYRQARTCMKRLEKIFSKMKILESNHGSLHLRKQKSYGLPKGFFRDYNEAWDVGPDWEWKYEFAIRMINGALCYFHHGKASEVLKLSQSLGMSAVQGHFHEKMGAKYWKSPAGMFWAAQTGCLVDHKSLAMAYARNNLKDPLLGSLIIINGYPVSIPFILDKDHRWIGRLV